MTHPVQHQVVAMFDRRGEAVPRVVVAGRTYQQDRRCVPLPHDVTCAVCLSTEGCECSDPGAAHEPVLAREWELPPADEVAF